jgi:hypothetical protein
VITRLRVQVLIVLLVIGAGVGYYFYRRRKNGYIRAGTTSRHVFVLWCDVRACASRV